MEKLCGGSGVLRHTSGGRGRWPRPAVDQAVNGQGLALRTPSLWLYELTSLCAKRVHYCTAAVSCPPSRAMGADPSHDGPNFVSIFTLVSRKSHAMGTMAWYTVANGTS